MVTIRYFATDGSYRELPLDAAVSQQHVKSVEVTKYPVEDGAVISDHAILLQDTYQVEGLVSNAPLVDPAEMGAMARRAETARDRLEAIIVAREPVTIDTGAKVLEMMVLSGLTFPRDSAAGDCTRFSCSATQITVSRSETVALPRSGKPGVKRGGRQPTQAAPEPVKRRVSVLKQLIDAIRNGGQ